MRFSFAEQFTESCKTFLTSVLGRILGHGAKMLGKRSCLESCHCMQMSAHYGLADRLLSVLWQTAAKRSIHGSLIVSLFLVSTNLEIT